MSGNELKDTTTGTVLIQHGSAPQESSSGQGFFSIGGGNGFSGGFGGSSNKRRKKRQKARARAQAEARARDQAVAAAQAQAIALAQAAANQAAHRQLINSYSSIQAASKAGIDGRFAKDAQGLAESVAAQLKAVRRPPPSVTPGERWDLHLINRERDQINALIAAKSEQREQKQTAAKAFDGHDPLSRSLQDYLDRLAGYESTSAALAGGHDAWETAYTAAKEAEQHTDAIDLLNSRLDALAERYAKQEIAWRETQKRLERHRQLTEQREERIRFRQRATEEARREWSWHANTLTLPMSSTTAGGWILTNTATQLGQAGLALEKAVRKGVAEILRIAALRAGQSVGLFATAVFYHAELGNGELTPEQRQRLSQGIAVPAASLGLPPGADLHGIAQAGGEVDLEYRVRPESIQGGMQFLVAETGGELSSKVPVFNATHDPLTGNYSVKTKDFPPKNIQFPSGAAAGGTHEGQTQSSSPGRLYLPEMMVGELANDADLRINDCIVCVPDQPPMYISFEPPPLGTGVVSGGGPSATRQWWDGAKPGSGAAIPGQFGDQFRGREFKSFDAFSDALWRSIAGDPSLVGPFSEANRNRMAQGLGPVAPKSNWVGESREYELRYPASAFNGGNPYELDGLGIHAPDSRQGIRPGSINLKPWLGVQAPGTTGNRPNWTPLVPPGIEELGSTTLPIEPPLPTDLSGTGTDPVGSQNETLPAVDGADVNASIPGYGEGTDLPSPDLLFQDRRDDPGVASGYGVPVSGLWLGESARGQGAPIPSQIADRLRGREFASFHRFREAFWKEVANDMELSQQFRPINFSTMKVKGLSPFAPKSEQVGGREKFEIHHVIPIGMGGAVYDIDNMRLLTPKAHISTHSNKGNSDGL